MYLGSLTCGRDANPVIFIFKLGLIQKRICKVVGFDIEDGIDTIEAGIEGQLQQKKKSVQTNKICKQLTHFIAMCVVFPHPPPAHWTVP